MDPDQPAHSRSLIRIHAVRLQTLLQVDKLIANSMDPDQTARRQAGLDPCWSQTANPLCWICHGTAHFLITPEMQFFFLFQNLQTKNFDNYHFRCIMTLYKVGILYILYIFVFCYFPCRLVYLLY
jgi:hypothetical protein